VAYHDTGGARRGRGRLVGAVPIAHLWAGAYG
jgi:hypothetical protein